MKKQFLAKFVIFFLFSVLNFAQSQTAIPKVLKPDYSWITLSFLALVVVGLIGAIGYMLGGLFGDRIKIYSKNLIYSVIKSAIIIFIIVSIFLFANQQTIAPLFAINIFSIDLTIEYAKVIRATLLNYFFLMTGITTVASYFGNIAPYFRPAGLIGISFSIAPAFRPFFDVTGILLSAISTSTAIWYGQIWFLTFIQTKFFSLFLPVGIFLRATKFEGIGNALIALAIGFFFIYPFLLNIAFDMFNTYIKLQASSSYIITSSDAKKFSTVEECIKYKLEQLQQGKYIECSIEADKGFFDILKDLLFGTLKNLNLIHFLLIVMLSQSYSFSLFLYFLVFALLFFIKITIEYVVVLSLLLPALVIFFTFLSIDEIAKFLGTEIDISAFEKIF
ncbi:MAG: hypothetical protein ACK4J0_01035 [Candidatus Anstonellaceae archaeon]